MKKVILSALALSLIMLFSVNASLAYLTDKDSVYNSFTVGQVGLVLSEEAAAEGSSARTDATLIPGLTYHKKPVVTVEADSEDCWLFVKVENGLESIEPTGEKSIAAQLENNGWLPLEAAEGIYYYSTPASAGESIPTFDSFTVSPQVTESQLMACNKAAVGVTAYGIQAAGFDTAAEAWAEAKLS